jgi:peptide/nickel transport system ATP-binding protein
MADPVLDVRGLTCRYRTTLGDRTAVDGVDLRVERGEILGIAGESGSGKSTLVTAVLGLLRPPGYVAGGQVLLHPRGGKAVDVLSMSAGALRPIRWRTLSYLPQGSMSSLNPVMRVGHQFLDVMQEHSSLSRGDAMREIPRLLARVGLDPQVADMYPHELSGGMKQRTIMAMAVALGPDLLLADEPTTALDVTIQRVVIQNLAELREQLGVTLVVVTHDMGVHAQLADRVAVMHEGRVVEVGPVRQVFKAPEHEYTRALIGSIPTLDVHQRRDRRPERV